MANWFGMDSGPETVIKKYPNRRLYDAGRNAHVTLTELADRVKNGERIRVVDHQSGEDLTAVIMGQVLLETLKARPDYLPLDMVLLMIRAQDSVVRDFLQHGVPQAFQWYVEAQRRMMSGMGWLPQMPAMPQGFPNMTMGAGFQHPFGGAVGQFGSQPGAPAAGAPNPGPVPGSTAGTAMPPGSAPVTPGSVPNAGSEGAGLRDELDRLRREVENLKGKPAESQRKKRGSRG